VQHRHDGSVGGGRRRGAARAVTSKDQRERVGSVGLGGRREPALACESNASRLLGMKMCLLVDSASTLMRGRRRRERSRERKQAQRDEIVTELLGRVILMYISARS
jgi:hypothetical protein